MAGQSAGWYRDNRDATRASCAEKDIEAIIPNHPHQVQLLDIDAETYRNHWKIERFLGSLKQHRRTATSHKKYILYIIILLLLYINPSW